MLDEASRGFGRREGSVRNAVVNLDQKEGKEWMFYQRTKWLELNESGGDGGERRRREDEVFMQR